MSEILLDSLVRSVDALEKKTDKIQEQVNGLPDHSEFHKSVADRLDAAEYDIKELPGKILMPLPEILGLTHELQVHSRQLAIPLKQQIRHEYHLGKPFATIIIFCQIIVILIFMLYYTWFQVQNSTNKMI